MAKQLRRARVMFRDKLAGVVEETAAGYRFAYDHAFLSVGQAISQSLPLRPEPFVSNSLFPFFRGLLPDPTGIFNCPGI